MLVAISFICGMENYLNDESDNINKKKVLATKY